MAVWLHAAAPVTTTSRLMVICLSGRRHHKRRGWDETSKKVIQDDASSSSRLIVNVEDLGKGARDALRRVARMGSSFVDEFRSTVRVSRESGIVVSPGRSSLDYAGFAALCLLLVALVGKSVLVVSRRWQQPKAVVRRDRSLGGKEVVVRQQEKKGLISLDGHEKLSSTNSSRNQRVGRVKREPRVPHWWSSSSQTHISSPADADSYSQAQVKALVRVIAEKRLSGRDFMEEDIVQLRQLCRNSGAKADFDTENTRDSFYRAAVAFLLSACASISTASNISSVEYGGEGVVSFICGLAADINLNVSRAASIVNAAVAARTRAGFLQAWANAVQGNASEADEEIRQLVCLHLVFPPDKNSPHMEMVGRGLQNHLAFHERMELLNMYTKFVNNGSSTYAAMEALGLTSASTC